MKKIATEDLVVKQALGDFTFDEHLEHIRRDGVPSSHEFYRAAALRGMGLKNPSPIAENVIVFGCFRPFSGQKDITGYLRLLDRLGIDYTWLDKENCCGSALLDPALDPGGGNRVRALEQSRESMGMNIAEARRRGAKRMAYMCPWCTHIARMNFPGVDVAQLYLLDILIDRIAGKNLQLEPTTIGYYEGCRLRARHQTPGITLDWAPYRQMVGAIKGLEIVDMTKKFCCTHQMDRIIGEVEKNNLRTVVTPCPACIARLRPALAGKAVVKSVDELLLEALDRT